MSNSFGNSFGRTFKLLSIKWPLLLYPLLSALIGFAILVPVTAVIILLYFMPLVDSLPQLSEEQVGQVLFNYFLSPGTTGLIVIGVFIFIAIAIQAFIMGAQSGIFKNAIKGLSIKVGDYFSSGVKYWLKVFPVFLVGTAFFGVPVILFFKFGIVQNLQSLILNPDNVATSFFMAIFIFSLTMIFLSLIYNLITYFWLPSLIVGDRDLIGGFKQSASLGFKNVLYLIAIGVIQFIVYTVISVINNLKSESILIIILVILSNYLFSIYFWLFKFVWYDDMNTVNKFEDSFDEPNQFSEPDPEPDNQPPGTVL